MRVVMTRTRRLKLKQRPTRRSAPPAFLLSHRWMRDNELGLSWTSKFVIFSLVLFMLLKKPSILTWFFKQNYFALGRGFHHFLKLPHRNAKKKSKANSLVQLLVSLDVASVLIFLSLS